MHSLVAATAASDRPPPTETLLVPTSDPEEQPMRTRSLRLALPLVVAGVLAACGDDGPDESADTDDAAATTVAAADTTMAGAATTMAGSATSMAGSATTMAGSATTMAAEGDLVDTAVAAGQFNTLVTAVQAAELEETLRGDGPFTVFAPTDEAFAALPEGTLDTLLEDPTGDLAGILTYHVVDGSVMAADVAGLDGQEVTTVNGATFTVNVGDDGSVTLTDAAGNEVTVVQTDVPASNGVIHVIDGVLLPA
jgi:uncharacterized surface protein with fasciclin (FAS1) repeats